MWGKIAGLLIIIFILFGLFVPINTTDTGSNGSTQTSTIAITYGETTYNNQNYKNIVNQYFTDNSDVNLDDAKQTIITASEVNKISQGISNRTYNENQILSCALVDLSSKDDLKVDVDKSKITLVTENMYKSALNSSGITQGYVVVTSPTTATGESALAGVMQSYEKATGKQIPDALKDAANKEIYTESQVVNDSNATADQVADVVSQAKEEAEKQNTTDPTTITNIITNITQNNNININNNSINDLADSVATSQSLKGEASDYQSQISDYVNNNDAQTLFEQIYNYITSLFNFGNSDSQPTSSNDNISNSSSDNYTENNLTN